MKKGFFFSLDGFMAITLFILILVSMYLFFINSRSLDQQYYFSEDLFDVFSDVKISELDYSTYGTVFDFIVDRKINDTDLTISEQIIDFALAENNEDAAAFIQDLTNGLFDNRFGVAFELQMRYIQRHQKGMLWLQEEDYCPVKIILQIIHQMCSHQVRICFCGLSLNRN